MTTLVTGATGHLGANLVRLLLDEGHAVRVLVRPAGHREALEGLRCDVVLGDVLDPSAAARAARGCETIFHLAAVNRLTAAHPEEIIRPALAGTRNVLSAALEAGATRIVYTSSLATVGRSSTPDRPVTEEDFAPPGSIPYVQGKVAAEAWVRDLQRSTGAFIVILNPSAVLGPYDYRGTPVSRLVTQFLRGGPVPVLPGGLNVVDARDVARAHLLAATRGQPGERYIVGGTNVTYAELYQQLATVSRRRPLRVPVPRHAGWAAAAAVELACRLIGRRSPVTLAMAREILGRYSFCDTTKARLQLGHAPRPLRETLQDTVAWFRSRSVG